MERRVSEVQMDVAQAEAKFAASKTDCDNCEEAFSRSFTAEAKLAETQAREDRLVKLYEERVVGLEAALARVVEALERCLPAIEMYANLGDADAAHAALAVAKAGEVKP